MVVFPLLYPEIFQRFNVSPPRGVLFYGPPGTGKTLVARSLANTCTASGKKIAFFMRKGADCLSKWVGEAERQLRLLFQEAFQMQPSIIFFDEIDGLAPVRSSKQDQIHSSIVSTLLALMDGLDSRGQVIVIGATNRIDSIDPALRRPGRFDREFLFGLPSKEARKSILDIHTRSWNPPLNEALKEELSNLTVGYCGADIKALCTESTLVSVRRAYPQLYDSAERLLIDVNKIDVTRADFMAAMKSIVPASHRAATVFAAALNPLIQPILNRPLEVLTQLTNHIFPAISCKPGQDEQLNKCDPLRTYYRPRLLIHGKPGLGQSYLASALLYKLEEFPISALDIATLFANTAAKVFNFLLFVDVILILTLVVVWKDN
jgi:SpoVK/Ycf46/Vps4 family AAA+-type ATPase